MAFYTLEPWGCEMEDFRAGMVASTVYNMARGPNQKALSARDFMPRHGEPSKPQSAEDIKAQWLQVLKIEKRRNKP